MLTVIVEASLASSEGCNDLRIPSELNGRGSSRSVVYIEQARFFLALIGSDYGLGPGWKTLALSCSIWL